MDIPSLDALWTFLAWMHYVYSEAKLRKLRL